MKAGLSLLTAASAVLAASVSAHAPSRRPPHVVLIVIDALRADHLPCYGYGKDTAPFLSRMAAQGVVFERAYSTSGWTAPAMASLFTSLYPFQHNVVTGFWATERIRKAGAEIELNRIPEEVESLAKAMKKAGYATYAVTANINVGEEMGFSEGFDRHKNYPGEKRPGDVINAKLTQWEEGIKRSGEYFLYLHYVDTHAPYRARRPWFRPGEDSARSQVSAYDSEIRYVDSMIQEAFERFGWARDALVVVTADHGEELGDHGGWGHSRTLFSEILHVPLLMQFPGHAYRGRRIGQAVSHIDVLPTLREAVGLAPDPRNEGLSLGPLLRGQAWGERALFAHMMRKDWGGMVVTSAIRGDWKYVEAAPGRRMLFNLKRDPREKLNLIVAFPAVAGSLEARFAEFAKSSRKYSAKSRSVRLDAEAVENLRALGYVH